MENFQRGVTVVTTVVSFYFAYKLYKYIEQNYKNENQAFIEGEKVAKRLKDKGLDFELSSHELAVCCDVVFSEDCEIDFQKVAGLGDAKDGLKDVVNVFKRKDEISTKGKKGKLLQAPKGVLLYGPPGNGKTLLATAMAKECGANFIQMRSSTLFCKYYGESEKYAKAYFSLAKKLQPCVIFIDEVDLLLARDTGFQATHNKIIGTVLSLWDGLKEKEDDHIVVIAASNRPENIDTALHRRMPRQFYIGYPDEDLRRQILEMYLLEDEPRTSRALIALIAKYSDKYCGSDLMELCKSAATIRFRSLGDRPYTSEDFYEAFKIVKFAGHSGEETNEEKDLKKLEQFKKESKLIEDF